MGNTLLDRRCARFPLQYAILAIALVAIVDGASTKAGLATLNSQSRFVLLTTDGLPAPYGGQTLQQSAPDFGSFNAGIDSNQFAPQVPYTRQLVGQLSSISAASNALTIQDSATATQPNITLNGLGYQSYFDVKFTLLTPATFTATYQSQAGSRYGVNPGPASQFTGPGAPGTLSNSLFNFMSPVEYSGDLEPGTFEIVANLQNAGGTSSFIDLSVNIQSVPLPSAIWPALGTLVLLTWVVQGLRSANHSNGFRHRRARRTHASFLVSFALRHPS